VRRRWSSILVSLISATAYASVTTVNDWVAGFPAARKFRHAVAARSGSRRPHEEHEGRGRGARQGRCRGNGKPAPVIEPAKSGVSAQFQEFVQDQSSKALSVITEISIASAARAVHPCRRRHVSAQGRQDRRRVSRAAPRDRRVLNEIDGQIQAYLMTLLIANILIALATWGALLLLKVPNAGSSRW
jgi:hypothetical protein